ncbi:hypothetical protein ACWCXC_08680 [Streptomyces sp. NPDC001515]
MAAIEASRGRTIRLTRIDEAPGDRPDVCGMRAIHGETTHIFYRSRPTPYQTERLVLHELAHEWLGHDLSSLSSPAELTASAQDISADVSARQIVHGRARYELAAEREAAMCAHLLAPRVGASAAGTDLISRLESTLAQPFGLHREVRGGATGSC